METPVFIISKGRPQCDTASVLQSIEYPGEWNIACQEDDQSLCEYKDNWGDRVVTYDYHVAAESTDMMDCFDSGVMGAAPARNGLLHIAMDSGFDRIWMIDDDITSFTLPNVSGKSRHSVKDGEELYKYMDIIDGFARSCSIPCIGGACDMSAFPPGKYDTNRYVRGMFDISTSEKFRSRMEEDLCYAVDSYTTLPVSINIAFKAIGFRTKGVCEQDGGCTDVYRENGDVRRAAYNVLSTPHTKVKCDKFGFSGFPEWSSLVPKTIEEKWAR